MLIHLSVAGVDSKQKNWPGQCNMWVIKPSMTDDDDSFMDDGEDDNGGEVETQNATSDHKASESTQTFAIASKAFPKCGLDIQSKLKFNQDEENEENENEEFAVIISALENSEYSSTQGWFFNAKGQIKNLHTGKCLVLHFDNILPFN